MECPQLLPYTLDLPLPEFESGHVWLVGAGPGNPGLLTLLALHALREADIIVHDALIEESVLVLAHPKSKLYNVGKRGGNHHSPMQRTVTSLLIELAHNNYRVLRLKGGDPFIFGRGLEELSGLRAAGIPVWIVPGLTAGIAGPATAGLAMTDSSNSAVTFITGSGPGGVIPSLNWHAIASGAPTLVLYMALHRLEEIVQHLLSAGRSVMDPVAIICDATTPHQKTLFSSLGQVTSVIAVAALRPPAIIVIGSGAIPVEQRCFFQERDETAPKRK